MESILEEKRLGKFKTIVLEILDEFSVKTNTHLPPELVDDALKIIHNPAFKHATSHLNSRTKATLAVYVALRKNNICVSPRCLEANVTGSRNLFISILKTLKMQNCEPADYILYASKKLGLDPSVVGNAVWIVLRLFNRFHRSRLEITQPVKALSRSVLAAGALYESGFTSGKRVLEKDLATILCVSEVSVRNALKHIRDMLGGDLWTWVEKVDQGKTEGITLEAPEKTFILRLVAPGRALAVVVFKEPSGDEWVRLARVLGLPVNGSVQLVDIINTGSEDYRELALEKSLTYLAVASGLGLGEYRVVWSENQDLTRILTNKGFRVAGIDPWGKKPVLVIDLNLLCNNPVV